MSETLARWPDWMAAPLCERYTVEIVDRRVTTEMDSGRVVRKEFDTDETVISCSLWLDPVRANWFEKFERDVLAQGSRWFWFPLWVGGQLVPHQARFRDRPTAGDKNGEYTVYNFTLDIGRREGLMDEWLFDLVTVYGPGLFSFISRLHKILHLSASGVTNTPANIWTAGEKQWEAAAK